jgi:aminoglycoside 2'-N-acetyltransferase I
MAEGLTVTSARTRDLDDEARADIIRLCIAAHDTPDFERLFSLVPPDGLHVLAYAGTDLVGHAVITTRWLQPNEHPLLRTAYIDAVSTSPDHQGHGVGSAVMREIERLATDSYEIGGLETDRHGFYERLGWERWRGPLAGRGEDGLIPTPKQTGVMILRLARTPALDPDGPMTIEVQPERIW